MSRIFEALEQARRERALPGAPVRTRSAPERPSRSAPAAFLTGSQPPDLYEEQHRLEAESVDSRLVSLVDRVSPAAEQYRNLRHIVEQAQRAEKVSLIAVSSPSIGDGKTTTAINLAGALAQAPEAQVLLIDADLRRPLVGRQLALVDSTPGLVGLIHDLALTLADVVRLCPPFNLWVLPAGSAIASPYEMLKSPRLGHFLEEARARYNYVVLDTPPLVSIPDCRIIGRHVDRFLVVVAAHRTPAKLLDEALRILPPSKNLGLVFNGGESVDTAYGYGAGYTVERLRQGTVNGVRPWYRGGRLVDRLLLRGAIAEGHEAQWR
jgi:capsular exopolysaccharide synthesis family protein